jgi:hypothetical protein
MLAASYVLAASKIYLPDAPYIREQLVSREAISSGDLK